MQSFSRLERIAAALYFIWFFLHLGLFFYSTESQDNSFFWPFYSGDKPFDITYDVTEFIVYTATPIILLIAYRIVFRINDYENSSGSRRHSTATFFISFLNEKIKAEELLQKLNELQNRPVNFDLLNQLKSDRDKIISQNVSDWLNKIEIKKKYKEFEK